MEFDDRDVFSIPTVITPNTFDDPDIFKRMLDNALAVDCLMDGSISIADYLDFVSEQGGDPEGMVDLIGSRLESLQTTGSCFL